MPDNPIEPKTEQPATQIDVLPLNIEIPENVKPIIKRLSPSEQNELILAFSVRKSWNGPMPPPDILSKYNDAIPDGAERILRMAEKQSDHRIEMESTVINKELNQSGRGQNYALIIVLLVLIASFFLVYTGHDTAGTVLGSIDLVAIASVFIIGKTAQRKDLVSKK